MEEKIIEQANAIAAAVQCISVQGTNNMIQLIGILQSANTIKDLVKEHLNEHIIG